MQRDLASVGVNVTDGANLALAYATQTTWERVRVDVIALKQSVSVGRGALSMSAGHSFEENFGSSLFISYQRPLGLQHAGALADPGIRPGHDRLAVRAALTHGGARVKNPGRCREPGRPSRRY